MKNEIRKVIVLLFLCGLTPAVVFSQKIKHVILIAGWICAYAFENAKIPNLRAKMRRLLELEARTVLPPLRVKLGIDVAVV
jgi:hypothetical protein